MLSKPFLTPKEQIKHCCDKGIQFNKISKTSALAYLEANNNYFKLRSYRKNFERDIKTRKYLRLDFAHLIDLAIIDNRLRRLLLEMSLSIEHFSKVHILKVLQESNEDGYEILQNYLHQLSDKNKAALIRDLKKNSGSTYCGNLYNKYMTSNNLINCPIWVFLEVISFGQYLHFYEFCVKLYPNKKELSLRLYLMRTVKDLRNACAHNNCIINDLRTPHAKPNFKPNQEVNDALNKLGVSKNIRNKQLKRAPFYQIVTTLYAHKQIVKSQGVNKHISNELKIFKERIYRDFNYHENEIIRATFDLLIKIFDNWFILEYDIATEKKHSCFCKSGIGRYRSIFYPLLKLIKNRFIR